MERFLKGCEGEEVMVVLEKYAEKKYRSLAQNNYYWGHVVKHASDWTGYDKNEMHAAFGSIFLRKDIEGNGVMKAEIIRSTTDLSTKEFMEYVDKCRKFLYENDVETEDPDPDWWKADIDKSKTSQEPLPKSLPF